jgi:hypothetical protein
MPNGMMSVCDCCGKTHLWDGYSGPLDWKTFEELDEDVRVYGGVDESMLAPLLAAMEKEGWDLVCDDCIRGERQN